MGFSLPTAIVGAFVANMVLVGALVYLRRVADTVRGSGWWAVGFTFNALRLLVDFSEGVIGQPLATFLAESFHAVQAVLIVVGTVVFLGRRPPKAVIAFACVAVVLWAALTSYLVPGFLLRTIPLYGTAGLALVYAGSVLVADSRRFPRSGRTIGGVTMILWGLHKLDYPFLRPVAWFAPWGFTIHQGLAMAVALAFMIMALKVLHLRAETAAEERRRAEAAGRALQTELAHVSRLSTVGEIAAGFAHELNQPLTAVANYAAAALRAGQSKKMDDADFRYVLTAIAEQAQRAGAIIHRIRGFVEKTVPEKTETDLNAAIRGAVGLLSGEVLRCNTRIALELDAGLPPVLADVVQIQQVMVNLVRNSIEAIEAEGAERREVVISTASVEPGRAMVAVADTGPGIPEDRRERIFEPFFTTKSAGMGIGLPICRRIIEDHGGDIALSPNPGGGITVTFTLPTNARPTADG